MNATTEKLLQKFISHKLRNYKEPQRVGTPKGDPIGFMSDKYAASLHMLRKAKKKDIANYLNISYGVLRTWNTEENFKEAIKKNKREFDTWRIELEKKARLDDILQKRAVLSGRRSGAGGGIATSRESKPETEDQIKIMVMRSLVKDAIDILEGKNLSDNDRRKALRYLQAVIR